MKRAIDIILYTGVGIDKDNQLINKADEYLDSLRLYNKLYYDYNRNEWSVLELAIIIILI